MLFDTSSCPASLASSREESTQESATETWHTLEYSIYRSDGEERRSGWAGVGAKMFSTKYAVGHHHGSKVTYYSVCRVVHSAVEAQQGHDSQAAQLLNETDEIAEKVWL